MAVSIPGVRLLQGVGYSDSIIRRFRTLFWVQNFRKKIGSMKKLWIFLRGHYKIGLFWRGGCYLYTFLGFLSLKYRMEIFLRSQNFKYVLGLVLPDISNIFCKQLMLGPSLRIKKK